MYSDTSHVYFGFNEQLIFSGPERIIVTRQQRQTVTKPTAAAPVTNRQKENRIVVHNNNTATTTNHNYVKGRTKPSVVIVKKIRVDRGNSDLDKMFDEHNYGHAKRNSLNSKYETLENDSQDLNSCNKKPIQSYLGVEKNGLLTPAEQIASEQENSDNDTTTSCIASGGVTVSLASQASESHQKCTHEGKCSSNDGVDKHSSHETCGVQREENETREFNASVSSSSTSSATCSQCTQCTSTPNGNCDGELNSDCKCDCTTKESCVTSGCWNKGDHLGDKVIMKYTTHGSECRVNSCDSSVQDITVEGHLQQQTVCVKDTCKVKRIENNSDLLCKNSTQVITISSHNGDTNGDSDTLSMEHGNNSLDGENSRVNMVSIKGTKSMKQDPSAVQSTSVKANTKMPYVKVMPNKDFGSETNIDKKAPETLVINISRGHDGNSQLTKSFLVNSKHATQSHKQSSDNLSQKNYISEKQTMNTVGIIKSIVLNDNIRDCNKRNSVSKPVVYSMIPNHKPRLEMPDCDSINCQTKAMACSSLKALDLTDTMCTDNSHSSVHLLSPDRRNPDSMGVVESPVMQSCSDLTYEEHTDVNSVHTEKKNSVNVEQLDCKKGVNENSAMKNNSIIVQTCSAESFKFSCKGLETQELTNESRLNFSESLINCDNYNSSKDLTTDTADGEAPVFRLDSDHCYAGAPEVKSQLASVDWDAQCASDDTGVSIASTEPETPVTETETPVATSAVAASASTMSELSQDSGYEDTTTQSPVSEAQQFIATPIPTPPVSVAVTDRPPNMKNLVPVLVSVNSNGSLTLHDSNLTKTLGGKMFALPESFASGIKLVPGSNIASLSQPLILSPVGKTVSPVITDVPRLVPTHTGESILGLLSPQKSDPQFKLKVKATANKSPPKVGKFKIGSYGSFSNTGIKFETNITPVADVGNLSSAFTSKQVDKPQEKVKRTASRSRSNSGKSSPAVMDSLGSLVQKVRGNLSQSPVPSVMENSPVVVPQDHIQHDHDYCTKNMMPTMVTSLLEQRLLQKEPPKPKQIHHHKNRKGESDIYREINKSERNLKRKRLSSSLGHMDSFDDIEVDSESDTQSIPEKTKPRFEKFYEKTRKPDPKVKITGSSNFQDQFVYFMNTTKRSRRRESKDSPLLMTDRPFIPPKPGDIIVPHLTEQDIENLKLRSKNSKHSGQNSNFLRNEFMAAKLANQQFPAQPAESADDEKSIINTILQMENDESLASPVPSEPTSYNESMEMYGQGVSNDLLNIFPEQMNLTQEQIDLLYSAVDEVQNSSPGLINTDKLVSGSASQTFSNFPIPEFGATTDLVSTPTPSTNATEPSFGQLNSNASDPISKVVEPIESSSVTIQKKDKPETCSQENVKDVTPPPTNDTKNDSPKTDSINCKASEPCSVDTESTTPAPTTPTVELVVDSAPTVTDQPGADDDGSDVVAEEPADRPATPIVAIEQGNKTGKKT